ncbi:hypothetical protein HK098_002448 [Nowakowskiella sp. JEL0407]|nr:hypothetical protein HK098_002448 [Nowakowskiella sp. JEL0407]
MDVRNVFNCPISSNKNGQICWITVVSTFTPLGTFVFESYWVHFVAFLIFFGTLLSIIFEYRKPTGKYTYIKINLTIALPLEFIVLWALPLLTPWPLRPPLDIFKSVDELDWAIWLTVSAIWSVLTYILVFICRLKLLRIARKHDLYGVPKAASQTQQRQISRMWDSDEKILSTIADLGISSPLTTGLNRLNHSTTNIPPPTPNEISPIIAAIENGTPNFERAHVHQSPIYPPSQSSPPTSVNGRKDNSKYQIYQMTRLTPLIEATSSSLTLPEKETRNISVPQSKKEENVSSTTQTKQIRSIPPPVSGITRSTSPNLGQSFNSNGTVVLHEESEFSTSPTTASSAYLYPTSNSLFNSNYPTNSEAEVSSFDPMAYSTPLRRTGSPSPTYESGSSRRKFHSKTPSSDSYRLSPIQPIPIVMNSLGRPMYVNSDNSSKDSSSLVTTKPNISSNSSYQKIW